MQPGDHTPNYTSLTDVTRTAHPDLAGKAAINRSHPVRCAKIFVEENSDFGSGVIVSKQRQAIANRD